MQLVSFLSHLDSPGRNNFLKIHGGYLKYNSSDEPPVVVPLDISIQDVLNRYGHLGNNDMDLMTSLSMHAQAASLPLSKLQLVSPIPHPPSLRDGYTFLGHVKNARASRGLEVPQEFFEAPTFYFSNHHAVLGPGAVEVGSLHLDRLDFEIEAACVVGTQIKNATLEQSTDSLFGYMIMNDWSARGLQSREMKIGLGPAKGKDFGTSLGPALVTRWELKEKGLLFDSPQGERLNSLGQAWINDEKITEGSFDSMHWSFSQLIQHASYGVTLVPGDIMGSGSMTEGCLLELNALRKTSSWLKPGDSIKLKIEGLGSLENTIQKGTY